MYNKLFKFLHNKNMTTTILAHKLLTMKLNRSEFEKIKWQRVYNMQKKHKAVDSLRHIIDKQVLNKTCRLCLKAGGKKIFGSTQDFDIANNIKYILGIEIVESDGKPQYICGSCENTIRMAMQLREIAETTQWRLQQELDIVTELTSECNDEDLDHQHGGYFSVRCGDTIREWVCGKCRRTFQSQEEFSEHEKLPTCRSKFRCYVCETCGLELKSMSRLKRHRLIHSGELQHPCPQCPYRARTKYALAVHERSHTGDRPVRCPLCPATFPNSSNLASHRRRHMPPRYHCELCQKGFKFKEALQNHIATQHSNAKPYNCGSCGKAFSTRKMIRRHELKVHNRPKMRSGITPSYIRQQQEQFNT